VGWESGRMGGAGASGFLYVFFFSAAVTDRIVIGIE
jgi:hypothetical protein